MDLARLYVEAPIVKLPNKVDWTDTDKMTDIRD